MIIKSVNLETVCGITSKLPENVLPEIAFAGKSNVGKSSLINGLMNRKSLARTSSQPGKTQTINFYNINEALYFVDLPGYGYAKVSESIKEKWGKMIENYLHKSKQLRTVFLLIDIRHEPSANDKNMYEWIVYQGYDPIIIATKMDKALFLFTLVFTQPLAAIIRIHQKIRLIELFMETIALFDIFCISL